MVRAILPNLPIHDDKTAPLPEDQLRKVFKKYDTNNDNLLSKEELKKAFQYLGSIIPGFRANRGLHHADANKDGYVNEGEMDELVNYAVRVGFGIKAA
ncbi:putative calcium-binding protein cml26 [Quercus suber]|uniref:Calcium-binding protein cml26 n=1 Tax=Quercus suber TaxID=58331 RepID=A0AAW0LKL8_QUESU|nr:putative calcium-binding protein cml10 [Quercus suber]